MDLPKFILGDNTDFPDSIFIIHTDYPRFILNLENDSIKWFENFSELDEEELLAQTKELIDEASDFYDREVSRYK
ncbi:MAG: hypothetical protein OR998_04660 [Flavobacteriaceae bacterium]|jgi:hypothetical protein|nr:hypothetical protein [Flavobacteriaceae bacterium]CAI8328479.1 MAG: Uncharacterised protein [Flavobacteriaceae bacterium]|tara:strand:- start:2309 stop:2533 length:225 start_codon:yes stop_codon:yes gene_type:complete